MSVGDDGPNDADRDFYTDLIDVVQNYVYRAFVFNQNTEMAQVQGQNTPRLIVDLRHKEGRSLRNLDFEALYVAISRITLAKHLRIIVSNDYAMDLKHITRLRRPEHFSRWMKCYTPDGIFNANALRKLGAQERAQALDTVQNWSRSDMRKQNRSRLLKLARTLGLSVKCSGRGKQPLRDDASALFPIWRAAHPNRSSYKSRQEIFRICINTN